LKHIGIQNNAINKDLVDGVGMLDPRFAGEHGGQGTSVELEDIKNINSDNSKSLEAQSNG